MRPLRIAGYYSARDRFAARGCSAGLAVYLTLRASLPQLDGEVRRADAAARRPPSSATRRARRRSARASRRDLAFATGFAHAPGSFLPDGSDASRGGGRAGGAARHAAAGDGQEVPHPWLSPRRAQVIAQAAPARSRAARCLRGGRELRSGQMPARGRGSTCCCAAQPAPWRAEDSVLVAFSMYLNLNDSSGDGGAGARAAARSAAAGSCSPSCIRSAPSGMRRSWAAPGGRRRFRARKSSIFASARARTRRCDTPPSPASLDDEPFVGSNSWAVAGTHTQDNAALLANDMHLSLRLPHVWYRARLIVECGRRGAARSGRRDVARLADADRRQQRSRRLGLHEQLRRLDRPRRRRDRSAGSRRAT